MPGILLVDDDPAILESFSAILRQEGYTVWEASTGKETLNLALAKRPGLVLLDVHLPDGDGIELCQRMKSDERLQDMCVALFSGEATDSTHKLRGADSGADDYIVKPVQPAELLARVRTLMRLRNTAAALRASEQYYRGLIGILPDGVLLMNLQGRLLSVNARAVAMLGYADGPELLQQIAFDLVAPEDQERLRSDIATTIGAGRLPAVEYTLVRRNGERVPVEISAASLQTAQGHALTIVVVVRDITERKRAQEQIRLLADAVQSTQELICITDPDNRFTFINQAFAKAYGCTEAEVLGKRPDFLYSPRNPEGLCDKIFQATLNGGWSGELLNLRKNGQEFPVALSTSRILGSDGQMLALVGVARDISEVKRAEKQHAALTELGYRLSAAATAAQAAEIILQMASDLFGWDAGYVHLYAERDDTIVPVLTVDTIDGVRSPVSPLSMNLEPSALMRLVMKKGARLLHRDGHGQLPAEPEPFGDKSRRSASMMYAPIRSAGAVVGLISVQSYRLGVYTHDDLALLQALADHCGDALQRIKMTEALREAEAKYRAIVEHDRRLQKAILNNISDPAWLKDAQGRFLACNDALSRMLGREISEILGRSAGELRLPEAHRLASEDTEVIRARKPTRFELEQPGPEGRRKWFETIISPLSGGQGEINGTVGIARDITLRKILEEELRHLPRRIMAVQEAERLRVSRDLHDGVNQLLASVQMRLRRVQETLPEKPAAREILARCHDLLTRALEENRRIAHDLRPSELDQLGLAAACRHLCKELALRTKLSVRCLIRGLPERLTPEIELNLFRIVQEALNNVEKHANASRVVLSMMLRGGFILIRVKDDGKGFDPIRAQAAGGKTRGIGLTNIAERAAAIGGACEVESSLRHGSIIAVRVPWK